MTIISRASLLFTVIVFGACASDPPPPPATPTPVPVTESTTPPAPESAAAADTQAQAQAECQAAEDCKTRGEPAGGMQWSCDSGRCMEQAAPEPPKAEEQVAAVPAEDQTPKKGKAKAKGKKK